MWDQFPPRGGNSIGRSSCLSSEVLSLDQAWLHGARWTFRFSVAIPSWLNSNRGWGGSSPAESARTKAVASMVRARAAQQTPRSALDARLLGSRVRRRRSGDMTASPSLSGCLDGSPGPSQTRVAIFLPKTSLQRLAPARIFWCPLRIRSCASGRCSLLTWLTAGACFVHMRPANGAKLLPTFRHFCKIVWSL